MLTIRHRRHFYEPRLPHMVFLDGLYVGMLRDDTLRLEAPPGNYALKVQFGGRLPIGKQGRSIDLSVSATRQVELSRKGDTICEFYDRERLWNLLFDIDLIVWVVSFFVTLPPAYRIISDTFFALWLVRLVLIRKKYYQIEILPDKKIN